MKPFCSVLITGVSGLIGTAVHNEIYGRSRKVTGVFMTHRPPPGCDGSFVRHDLTDLRATERLIADLAPSLVINCAANPDIAPCQAAPQSAAVINTEVPALMARCCREVGARFIHFSTDQVFDGSGCWYGENDPPKPVHVYGRTKRASEEAVLQADPEAVVLRISLVYGRSLTGERSASEKLAAALGFGRTLHLYTNEFRTPIFVEDVARAVAYLGVGEFSGLLHVAGPDRLSRLEFGRAVATTFGLDLSLVIPSRSRGLSDDPPRPCDLSLDTSLARAVLPFRFRGVEEGLATLT